MPASLDVLVLGATGTTGSRLVGRLAADGHRVRAATRRPGPAAGAVAPVHFDWDDASTHDAALAGADAAYLVGPVDGQDPGPPLVALATRARALGVGRLVLLSGSPLAAGGPAQGQAHAALAAGPSGWAVLRPTWFAQNFVVDHHIADAIAAGRDLVTATGDGRVAFVDADDIAAVAAVALTALEPLDDEAVLTGPATWSYAEVAALASELTGRPIAHRAVDPATAASAMAEAGVPPSTAKALATMEAAIAGGSEDRTTDAVQRLAGRPPRGLRDVLAAAHARAEARA